MGKWTRRAFISAGVLAGGVVVLGVAVRPGNRAAKVAKLVAGDEETLFNVWLKIAPDNTVTAIIPHAEMGQGVHTTLAMMLADELDADWNLVRMQEAPAVEEYANYALARGFALGDADFPAFLIDTVNGFFLTATKLIKLQITGGSTSTPTTGQLAMRVSGCRRAWRSAAGCRRCLGNGPRRAAGQQQSYLSRRQRPQRHVCRVRAGRRSHLSQSPAPVLKTPEQYTLMGTDVQRIDIPAKVDGTASFGIDANLPGMKYAAVKASPVFGNTVASVNEASIQAMPGVRKVVNLGDAVAVVADGYWQAKQAIDKLDIEFSQGDNDSLEQSDIFAQFAADMDAASASGNENHGFRIRQCQCRARERRDVSSKQSTGCRTCHMRQWSR